MDNVQASSVRLPENFLDDWQHIVDLVAKLADVPVALIMRLVEEDIMVFRSSHTEGNPYRPGDRETFADSGLYCETVIKENQGLLVPNALDDPRWCQNPDIKLNMISYLGFPIVFPDGQPFGTICVLDTRTNAYSDEIAQLMQKLRDLIQSNLELLYMNDVLGVENSTFSDYLEEIKALRRMLPMCSNCKSIRDDQGYWRSVEDYFAQYRATRFTHGICPDCMTKLYPEFKKKV